VLETSGMDAICSFWWWKVRIMKVHQNLIFAPSHTFKEESYRIMEKVLIPAYTAESSLFVKDEEFLSRLYLEWGLVLSQYNDTKRSSEVVSKAKELAGLRSEVTGVLGVRTKYQTTNYAQLVVKAESRGKVEKKAEIVPSDIPLHEDTILLKEMKRKDGEKEPNLSLLDQSILLAMCLDVKNSNPAHGLTNEMMMPYVERVMMHPNNWMIHSMSLLLRSRLEHERVKTIERSVIQLSELVKQFREDEKPGVAVRMLHFYGLMYPPVFAIRKELGSRYMELGMVRSAVLLYEELEMWEDIIKCYMVMEKPKRARTMLLERLKVDSENPVYWCLLGDLEEDNEKAVEYFLKAWKVSKQSYAKCMRDLGRYYVRKRLFQKAIDAIHTSLHLNPLYVRMWFLLGYSMIQLKAWKEAASAFTHVVQISPRDGEAWTNLSVVYVQTEETEKAFFAIQQALKLRERNTKMWYNFLILSMQLGEFFHAINALFSLTSLRGGGTDLFDYNVFRYLAVTVLKGKKEDQEESVGKQAFQFFKRRINQLIEHVKSNVTPAAIFWEIVGEVYIILDDIDAMIVCKEKYVYFLKIPSWNSQREKFHMVAKALHSLFASIVKHKREEKFLASFQSTLGNVIERAKTSFEDDAEHRKLTKLFHDLEYR